MRVNLPRQIFYCVSPPFCHPFFAWLMSRAMWLVILLLQFCQSREKALGEHCLADDGLRIKESGIGMSYKIEYFKVNDISPWHGIPLRSKRSTPTMFREPRW